MKFFKAFIGFLLTFLTIDALWISLFALDIYQTEIGHLLAKTPKLSAVVAFYLAYTAIAVHLTIRPAQTWKQAAFNGLLLGTVGYGTYAVTNYAFIAGWSSTIVIVDLFWGAAITATCSAVGFITANKQAKS